MDCDMRRSVHIILEILQGRGFDLVTDAFVFRAHLTGECLESDRYDPCTEPQLDIQFVWKRELISLNKMRNCQMKVELFTWERVGFVNVSLREAQVWQAGLPPGQVFYAWHTLIGVRGRINILPEVLLSIRVEEVTHRKNKTYTIPPELRNSHAPNVQYPTITFEINNGIDLIQVGPKSHNNILFYFTIHLLDVDNLNLFIPRKSQNKKYNFSFEFLGNMVSMKTFRGDKVSCYKSERSTWLRLRGSLQAIKQLFTWLSVVTLKLKRSEREIALSHIDVQSLLPTEDLNTFCTEHAVNNSYCVNGKFPLLDSKSKTIPENRSGKKPFVQTACELRLGGNFRRRRRIESNASHSSLYSSQSLNSDSSAVEASQENSSSLGAHDLAALSFKEPIANKIEVSTESLHFTGLEGSFIEQADCHVTEENSGSLKEETSSDTDVPSPSLQDHKRKINENIALDSSGLACDLQQYVTEPTEHSVQSSSTASSSISCEEENPCDYSSSWDIDTLCSAVSGNNNVELCKDDSGESLVKKSCVTSNVVQSVAIVLQGDPVGKGYSCEKNDTDGGPPVAGLEYCSDKHSPKNLPEINRGQGTNTEADKNVEMHQESSEAKNKNTYGIRNYDMEDKKNVEQVNVVSRKLSKNPVLCTSKQVEISTIAENNTDGASAMTKKNTSSNVAYYVMKDGQPMVAQAIKPVKLPELFKESAKLSARQETKSVIRSEKDCKMDPNSMHEKSKINSSVSLQISEHLKSNQPEKTSALSVKELGGNVKISLPKIEINPSIKSHHSKIRSDRNGIDSCSSSCANSITELISSQCSEISKEVISCKESYHDYKVSIKPKYVFFYHFISGPLYLRIEHPRIVSSSSKSLQFVLDKEDNSSNLNSFKCEVLYIALPHKVTELLSGWSPKLIISDNNGHGSSELMYARLMVDVQESSKKYKVLLRNMSQNRDVGVVTLTMGFKHVGVHNLGEHTNVKYLPPVITENIPQIGEGGGKRMLELEQYLLDCHQRRSRIEKQLFSTQKEFYREISKRNQEIDDREENMHKIYKRKVRRLKNSMSSYEDYLSGILSGLENEIGHLKCGIQTLEEENHSLRGELHLQDTKIQKLKSHISKSLEANTLEKKVMVLNTQLQCALKKRSHLVGNFKQIISDIHQLEE